jgi:hypothetical protein
MQKWEPTFRISDAQMGPITRKDCSVRSACSLPLALFAWFGHRDPNRQARINRRSIVILCVRVRSFLWFTCITPHG